MSDPIIHQLIDGERLSDAALREPPEQLQVLQTRIRDAQLALEEAALLIDVTLTSQPA